MSNQLSSLTLAQIVNSNHKAASVFEKYRLDFCCKGKRSLAQACDEQHLTLSQVAGDLQNIFSDTGNGSIDFNKMTLTQLCDYILQTHHAYVKN